MNTRNHSLHFLSLIIAALVLPALDAAEVSLAWDPPNPEPDAAGYRIYYTEPPATETQMADAGNSTAIIIGNLVEGVTYAFHATCYSSSGLESDPSETIEYTVPVSVPENHAPIAGAQSVSTAEHTAVSFVLAGSDVDGDPLMFTVVTGPAHGNLSGTAPNLTYTPAPNYHGADSFSFKANDGTVDSATATVSITITPVNDAPLAQAQSLTPLEDTSMNLVLTATDADNDSLTFGIVSQPTHGILSGTPPNLSYRPSTNYHGADSFSFKANDGTVDSATATVSITITPVNDAPLAQAQSLTPLEDTPMNLVLTATDADNNSLTFGIVSQPTHGILSGTPPNLSYRPSTNYHGADSFSFKANDGTVDSATATVSITITPVNDAPVAQAQSLTTVEDTSMNLVLTATDADNESLTFAIVSQPTHGILSGTPPNLSYRPSTNYHGADSFSFKANDGTVDSATATVSITITPVNDAPLAQAQSLTPLEDTPMNLVLTATDADNNSLTFGIVSQPTHGILSGTPPNLSYRPSTNYHGADSFSFKANDGTVDSATATVSITITPVNDAPVAQAQSLTTVEDTSMNLVLTATDADNESLTFAIVSQPTHGILSGTPPNLSYRPSTNYHGADSFSFKANDGTVDSAPATVSITIEDEPAELRFTDTQLTEYGVILSWASTEGNTYRVLYKTSLSDPGWAPLGETVGAIGTTTSYADRLAEQGLLCRYYMVERVE